MASKKTSAPKGAKKIVAPKKTAAPKTAKKAAAKPVKMFTSAGRLFGAAKDKALPKGSYANVVGTLDISGIKIRVGTEKAVVFEGSFQDLVSKAFEAQGIKLKLDGAQIAAPSGAPLASA